MNILKKLFRPQRKVYNSTRPNNYVIKANFEDYCRYCKNKTKVGQRIVFDADTRGVFDLKCADWITEEPG